MLHLLSGHGLAQRLRLLRVLQVSHTTEALMGNPIFLILNIPLETMGDVGNFHLNGTIQWGCLILGGWEYSDFFDEKSLGGLTILDPFPFEVQYIYIYMYIWLRVKM